MYKNYSKQKRINHHAAKLLLMTKLAISIVFLVIFQAEAKLVFAQKITLNEKNAKLQDVLKKIEKQSGYDFFYGSTRINMSKQVTIEVKNTDIKEVLTKIFEKEHLSFEFVDQNIVISKDESLVSKIQQYFVSFKVSGIVKDDDGLPLPGATIQVKGQSKYTTTNSKGEFSIEVDNETEILQISFIGYSNQEVVVGKTRTFSISLKQNIGRLNETVVVAYGTQKARTLTSAITTISGNELKDLPSTINVEQSLQGRAAGVFVIQETGQPGAATRVRIRGSSSLLGSNQPLYVVDGVPVIAESNLPVDNGTLTNALQQQGLSSPLNNLNPADIETISVLKDASATALYGSRAANGVVLITTKQGSSQGKPTYSFNSSFSVQNAQTQKVLNTAQFKEIWTEAANNSTSTAAVAVAIRNGTYFQNFDTNWADEISPTSPITQNYNLSASGGNDKTQYFTSFGYNKQDGTFNNSEFNRYNLLVKLSMQAAKSLKVGTSLNVSTSSQTSPDGSLLARTYDFRPDLAVYNPDGTFTFSDSFGSENPVALSLAKNVNVTNLLIGSAFGELSFAKNFKLRSVLSINYNNGNLNSLYPSQTVRGGWGRTTGEGTGFVADGTSVFYSHLLENTLTYNTIINKHQIDGLLGVSWQGDNSRSVNTSGTGLANDDVLNNIGDATSNINITSNRIQSGLESYFGRANYIYAGKYVLSVSARIDGSSKFASDNTYAFFPTVSGAWIVSDESFLKKAKFLDELKLRGSFGLTGQQNFSAYQWRTLFGSAEYNGEAAVLQNQLGNSRLKWELTEQLDIGLDFSFFKNRITGTIDYYQKNTSDLLFAVKLPGSTGFEQTIGNLGDTQNKGVEFALNGDVIATKVFTWNLGFNIANNRNKLVRLNSDFVSATTGNITPPSGGGVLRIGEPIGLLYGRVSNGLIQSQDELDRLNAGSPNGVYQNALTRPGDIKFEDLNGDGFISSLDQENIGNATPNISGGITSEWSYKGFRLSTLFTFVQGNEIRWGQQVNALTYTQSVTNKMDFALDRWTPTNPSNVPRPVLGDPNQNSLISSFWVHDGSYLRMKNLNLTYSIPKKLLFKTKFVKALDLNISATNLFTITKYPGANPETSNLFNNDISAGLDNSRFPIAKIYTLGIRSSF